MPRKLISSNRLLDKIALLIFLTSLWYIAVMDTLKHGLAHSSIIFLVASALLVGFLYFYFSYTTHPIYYDEQSLFYKRKGINQIVPLTEVRVIDVTSGYRRPNIVNIIYYEEGSKMQELRFILPGLLDPGSSQELMLELKQVMQSKQPGFNITVPSGWK